MVDTSRIISRFKFTFAGKIIQTAAAGLLIILLSRLLGSDMYGLLYLALAVFGFVEVFSRLGIAKATAKYISTNKGKKPASIPSFVKAGVLVNITVLFVVVLIFLLIHPYIASILDEPRLQSLLLVGVLYIIFKTTLLFIKRLLQGFEQIKASAVLSVIEQVLRLVFAVALVVLGFEAFGALVGFILAISITSVIGGLYIYKITSAIDSDAGLDNDHIEKIGRYAVPLTASSTANVLDKRIDSLLIGFFLGATSVSFYVISKQVTQFVETPVSALGFTIAPTLEIEKAGGNTTEAANLYQQAFSNVLLLYIPATVGIALIAEPLVRIVFGTEYLSVASVLQIFSLYILIQSITKITSNALDYLGRAKIRAVAKIITAILHVIISLILIPINGIEGAAISAVVTYGIYAIVCVGVMHLELKMEFYPVIRYTFISVVCSGAMAIAVYTLIPYITGIFTLLGVVTLGATIWSILILATGIIRVEEISALIR